MVRRKPRGSIDRLVLELSGNIVFTVIWSCKSCCGVHLWTPYRKRDRRKPEQADRQGSLSAVLAETVSGAAFGGWGTVPDRLFYLIWAAAEMTMKPCFSAFSEGFRWMY